MVKLELEEGLLAEEGLWEGPEDDVDGRTSSWYEKLPLFTSLYSQQSYSMLVAIVWLFECELQLK